jgi:hypothetical protein
MDSHPSKPKLTFEGIITLVTTLAPVLIAFFLLMLTCMNQDFKGLIFIAGILLALLLNKIIMPWVGSLRELDASATCSLVDLPFTNAFNSPSNSSLFISFTFTYLFIPMLYNNQLNYPVIILLLGLFVMDSYARVVHKCTTSMGIFLGTFLGILCGASWFTIFRITGADELLYFNELGSTSVRCNRPSEQTFKCSVYKNGVLVSHNIA